MPGRPMERACHRALDEREEEVFERLATGEFVTTLCREILAEPYAEHGDGEPKTHLFYSWLDAEEGRRARFERVREAAADMLAEESVRLIDEARKEGVSSTAEATLVKAQSNSRQWWASKLNRSKFGEGKTTTEVQLTIGELHLDALRKYGRRELNPDLVDPYAVKASEPSGVIEGEYEIEEG